MRPIQTQLAPQLFPSGLVSFFHTRDKALPGDLPKYAAERFLTVPFEDRRVGDVRYYAAMQASSRIDKVIRIPHAGGIHTAGDIAMLSGDERQYRVIKLTQNGMTTPVSWDVTLEVSKKQYQIAEVTGVDTGRI